MDRIFVQIACYRNAQCQATIHDLFAKATYPERIFAGVCLQADACTPNLALPAGLEPAQLRVERHSWEENQGICWERYRAQQLWDGEEFVLSIDGDMRLIAGWDELLIEQLAQCDVVKPVLTARVAVRRKGSSDTDVGRELQRPARMTSVHPDFLFAQSLMIKEVPSDLHLDAEHEEPALTARLYTHGYDVFSPTTAIAYREEPAETRPTSSQLLRERSRQRFHALFNANERQDASASIDLGRFGLGTDRALTVAPENVDQIVTFVDAVLKKNKPVFDLAGQPHFCRSAIVDDVPAGILIMNDYLDSNACRQIVAYADAQPSLPLGVGVYDKDSKVKNEATFRKDGLRVTEHVRIDGMPCEILNLFNDIYCHRVAPFYNVCFEAYERPQILRYPIGGQYLAHADADVWDADEQGWVRVLYRDYSVLLYLNDEYEGGSLRFIPQQFTLRPKAGMLVAFPSDHRFQHEAQPTTSGIRYAMVSWARIVGSKPAKLPYRATHIPLMQRPANA